ncbi:DUF6081 family protein [Saccharopolyspora rosea]|uniref:DUF6081 family protein n=1 Tax=Saccharopolyspora rosea TaxID=524884 RepID=A0ABW3FS47_9PSEU|nr:DUF6081 family protein [Saccharopolyspora rosea]
MTAAPGRTAVLFHDDFGEGLVTEGAAARWKLRPAGSAPGGDGIARGGPDGLVVESAGRDEATGDPAFTFAATGGDDHLKWNAMPRRSASSGMPGFDAPLHGRLTGAASMSARVFGAARHPFGRAVRDPDTDPRLAAAAFIAVDPETGVVCDFTLTNGRVYALYERLPGRDSARSAFCYVVPVADRVPEQQHELAISYRRSSPTVTWWLDGVQVLAVDELGRRALDGEFLAIDHGGVDEDAAPRQFLFGLAMFTLLDAAGPDGRGLVRLARDPDAYAPVRAGAAPSFVDDVGAVGSRVWGQGLRMHVRRFDVGTADEPTGSRG